MSINSRSTLIGALFVVLTLCANANVDLPKVVADYTTLIAHRGESIDAPENTLSAYKLACSRGFGFECDIYLSRDKQVFTYHNPSIPLLQPDGGRKNKACHDASWETEISKHDVTKEPTMSKFQERFSPVYPALLSDVLKLAKDGRWIYVEIKPGPEIVPYVKEIFAKQNIATPQNTLFISFNRESVKALKKQMGEYKVYWLAPCRQGGNHADPPQVAENIVDTLKELGADGIDIQWNSKIITAEFVRTVRNAGYEFHAWTIDDEAQAKLAFSRGVQTVTTNCAKKILDALHLSIK